MASQSNLPTVQRLKYEDYARSGTWQEAMQGLVNSLNLFMTPVYDILNGGVTYSNLTAPQRYTTVVTAGATTTFSFVNPLPIQPEAVLIGNVWSGIRSNHPAVALQVYWHIQGNTVVVDNIVGLTSGTQYSITLVIL
jgi:hypothetical protein